MVKSSRRKFRKRIISFIVSVAVAFGMLGGLFGFVAFAAPSEMFGYIDFFGDYAGDKNAQYKYTYGFKSGRHYVRLTAPFDMGYLWSESSAPRWGIIIGDDINEENASYSEICITSTNESGASGAGSLNVGRESKINDNGVVFSTEDMDYTVNGIDYELRITKRVYPSASGAIIIETEFENIGSQTIPNFGVTTGMDTQITLGSGNNNDGHEFFSLGNRLGFRAMHNNYQYLMLTGGLPELGVPDRWAAISYSSPYGGPDPTNHSGNSYYASYVGPGNYVDQSDYDSGVNILKNCDAGAKLWWDQANLPVGESRKCSYGMFMTEINTPPEITELNVEYVPAEDTLDDAPSALPGGTLHVSGTWKDTESSTVRIYASMDNGLSELMTDGLYSGDPVVEQDWIEYPDGYMNNIMKPYDNGFKFNYALPEDLSPGQHELVFYAVDSLNLNSYTKITALINVLAPDVKTLPFTRGPEKFHGTVQRSDEKIAEIDEAGFVYSLGDNKMPTIEDKLGSVETEYPIENNANYNTQPISAGVPSEIQNEQVYTVRAYCKAEDGKYYYGDPIIYSYSWIITYKHKTTKGTALSEGGVDIPYTTVARNQGTQNIKISNESTEDVRITDYGYRVIGYRLEGDGEASYTPLSINSNEYWMNNISATKDIAITLIYDLADLADIKLHQYTDTPTTADTAPTLSLLKIYGETTFNTNAKIDAKIQWFRVPLSTVGTVYDADTFDSGYNTTALTGNKGTHNNFAVGLINAKDNSYTYSSTTFTGTTDIVRNALYWYKITATLNATGELYEEVHCLRVDNKYEEVFVQYSGQAGVTSLYSNTATPLTEAVACDLSATSGGALDPAKIFSSTADFAGNSFVENVDGDTFASLTITPTDKSPEYINPNPSSITLLMKYGDGMLSYNGATFTLSKTFNYTDNQVTLTFAAEDVNGDIVADFSKANVINHIKDTAYTPSGIQSIQFYEIVGYRVGADVTVYEINEPSPAINTDTTITIVYRSTIIKVSLPIQMLFAAFKSNNGEVVSPEYTVTNSSSLPVKMELTKVELNDGGADGITLIGTADVNAVDENQLELQLTLSGESQGIPLTIGTYAPAYNFGTINRLTPMQFSLTGQYYGSYNDKIRLPEYKAVFKFTPD